MIKVINDGPWGETRGTYCEVINWLQNQMELASAKLGEELTLNIGKDGIEIIRWRDYCSDYEAVLSLEDGEGVFDFFTSDDPIATLHFAIQARKF